MAAPVPKNESERLRRLRRYGILDTPPTPRFDRIVRLAGRLLDCPIALVSLVDEHRQWFKARVGLDASQTPRADAFCAHTIMGEDVLVVTDAATDPRFADNPLVMGDPDIRFYAGAPLIVGGGLAMGTLCVIDRKPRELDEAGRAVLADLAQMVVDAMEHHRHAATRVQAHLELASAHDELRAISDAISRDVRAPLRQLGALLELFESDHRATLSEGAILELEEVRRVRARADEAIRGMTELARLPRDRKLECEDVNVAPILRELTETMRAFYPEMTLLCDLPERPVTANEPLLRQLLQHLVDNGFKHGGRNVRVEFSFDDVRTRISVLDDGPGISAVHNQMIFEPFRRLVPDSVPGTGVGLTVVKRIVEAHRGSVFVEPDRIGGSAFVVELPFDDPQGE
ncbi:MAG: sensor histidine kinase [Nannocystales bacterium]